MKRGASQAADELLRTFFEPLGAAADVRCESQQVAITAESVTIELRSFRPD